MSKKQIHIEKYDITTFEKEQKPYLMVLTDLIQKFPITHSSELLLWMFLESLPPTWKPNKNHIMAHFNISDRTYERYMSYLNATNLIEYRQDRNSSGTFGDWKLIVLNGTRFNPGAESNRSAKIDGTVVVRKKTAKVIHISDSNRTAKNGGTVQSSTTLASTEESSVPPFRQNTVERCDDGHINNTKRNTNTRKKTNNPVSVFSCTENVKTHIDMVIANRKDQESLQHDIIDQGIYYAYTTNQDQSFDSVNKRINIFLKKVREGKWLIPQGWNGITSQSIREEEERQQAEKQAQYKEDGEAFRAIAKAALSPTGEKSLSDILKKLKSGQ